MTRIQTLTVLSIVAFIAGACQPGSAEPPAEERAPVTPAESVAEQVTYEPAYPDDVSDEGLSEGDVAQHEATHSHDEGDHSHDDGDHAHDDDHSHGGGEHHHDDDDEHDDHEH